jgi:hypothetical protein
MHTEATNQNSKNVIEMLQNAPKHILFKKKSGGDTPAAADPRWLGAWPQTPMGGTAGGSAPKPPEEGWELEKMQG